jgi:hypothetical protein
VYKIIIIADISLTVANDDDILLLDEENDTSQMRKFQVKEGANSVDLECSFRLASHQKLDLRIQFVFTSAESKVKKIAWCNESNQNANNWVVTPNLDDNTCYLKIVNFSEADGGQYDCLMILINGHTAYSGDKSNTVFLAAERKLGPSKKINSKDEFGQMETGIFYVILSSTIAVVVAISAIIVVVVVKRYSNRFRFPMRQQRRHRSLGILILLSFSECRDKYS